MSRYQLQKLIYHVNREPERGERYRGDASGFVKSYDLTEQEIAAILNVDVRALYAMGVHSLCCGRSPYSIKSPSKTTPKR